RPSGHQRGHSSHGGLLVGDPAILGVQPALDQVLVGLDSIFLGGEESVQRTGRFDDRGSRAGGHRETSTYPAATNTTGSIANTPNAALIIAHPFPRTGVVMPTEGRGQRSVLRMIITVSSGR